MYSWSCTMDGATYQATAGQIARFVNAHTRPETWPPRLATLLQSDPDAMDTADADLIAKGVGMTLAQLVKRAAEMDDDGSGNKPCPFCGSDPVKYTLRQENIVHEPTYVATFGCSRCAARVSASGGTPAEAWAKAIDGWNTRA